MKVNVFGSGYVGLVVGACLSESGNEVVCVDIDEERIDGLKKGIVPFYEPGLEEMIKRNVSQKRLSFTVDFQKVIKDALVHFIAVGTPPDKDGGLDLRHVFAVAEAIGSHLEDYAVVVNKSTVPIGSADNIKKFIQKCLQDRGLDIEFDVVSNPEFLREGTAINDFMYPDRVVIGTDNPRTAALIKELHAPFMRNKDRAIIMGVRSAEMTKYASNSMLAARVSFINEVAKLCEKVGADIDQVRAGVGSDSRIGAKFLLPGIGYGGSCFPKDVQAMIQMGEKHGCPMDLTRAVQTVNQKQKRHLVDIIKNTCGDNLKEYRFAVWGLSFKPQTDDMREAPSIEVLNGLLALGAKITVADPAAIPQAQKIWGDAIEYRDYYYDALEEADALLLLTEWNDYISPDLKRMKTLMKEPVIFDGRNIYSPAKMKAAGFQYYSVGRS